MAPLAPKPSCIVEKIVENVTVGGIINSVVPAKLRGGVASGRAHGSALP